MLLVPAAQHVIAPDAPAWSGTARPYRLQTNLTPPSITGSGVINTVLTVVPGVWDEAIHATYQWYAAGSPIEGETGTSMTVLIGLLGLLITVGETPDGDASREAMSSNSILAVL